MIAVRYSAVVLASTKKKRKSKAPARKEAVGFDQTTTTEKLVADEQSRASSSSAVGDVVDQTTSKQHLVAERGAVLKACVGTSAGLAVGGFLFRGLSHVAAGDGWPVPDCTLLMPYRTEISRIAPTVGVILVVASVRQVLLQVWPDFAQSTQLANRQVLQNLKPVDLVAVSYLSGISEELVFRGALLPLLGLDWKGVFGAGFIFGALHLSGGRNASFAAWATLVGIVYGVLGVYTSDLAAPMAAHSAVNLLGAGIWKLSQRAQETKDV